MKKIILTTCVASALLTAQAQLFSPEAWNGALWGTLIGGVAGGGRHHGFSGEGAAIGAGAGFLLGSLASSARADRAYYYGPPYAAGYYPAYSSPSCYYYPSYPSYSYCIADAPTVNNAPTAPAAPQVPNNPAASYRPASAMSS